MPQTGLPAHGTASGSPPGRLTLRHAQHTLPPHRQVAALWQGDEEEALDLLGAGHVGWTVRVHHVFKVGPAERAQHATRTNSAAGWAGLRGSLSSGRQVLHAPSAAAQRDHDGQQAQSPRQKEHGTFCVRSSSRRTSTTCPAGRTPASRAAYFQPAAPAGCAACAACPQLLHQAGGRKQAGWWWGAQARGRLGGRTRHAGGTAGPLAVAGMQQPGGGCAEAASSLAAPSGPHAPSSPGRSRPPGSLKKEAPICSTSTCGWPCSCTTSTASTDRRRPSRAYLQGRSMGGR